MNRPSFKGSDITTPSAAFMLELLGGHRFGSIALTTDQLRHIQKLYGYVDEKPNKKPDAPIAPCREDFQFSWEYDHAFKDYERFKEMHDKWEDPKAFLQAGADRNAIRNAESDGLRIIAWLAKYIPAGEDPLKHLIQLLSNDIGFDIDYEDLSWANELDE